MLNEGSLGTSLRRGTFSMFFTGDGEVEANQRWRSTFATWSGNVSVLKVGHHGANNAVFDNGFSGASAWLAHTSPEVAVISANGRTHPRRNALNAILAVPQSATYCTSVHGEIVIRVAESGAYAVTAQRNPDQDCVPGAEADT
jgi:beta-lactamase superfamily II metal-dependent hydrolase